MSDTATDTPKDRRPGLGNANALRHGERSRLPLGKSAAGDEYMKHQVDAWRRAREAELAEKFGGISGHQEGLILTASEYEICRRRRKRLARLAATDEKRVEHEEAAAANSARRDSNIEKAGLGLPTAASNGRASTNGHHTTNGIMLPDHVLEAVEAADLPTDAADATDGVSVAENSEEADA